MVSAEMAIPARRPTAPPAVDLLQLLSVVAHARRIRLELVCWQLNVNDDQARPTWEAALERGLIEPFGSDVHTGQTMFVLSRQGRRVLEDGRPRRRRR